MKKIQFNKLCPAEFLKATICDAPLSLIVEKKLTGIPDGVTAEASPLAFCVEDELIKEAVSSLEGYDVVEIGEEDGILVRLVKMRTAT